MAETSIQWTDHSINPIRARNRETGAVGHYCEKVSKGCAHCYASNMQRRFAMPAFKGGRINLPTLPIGDNGDVTVSSEIEVFLDRSKLFEVLRRRKPTKYFWCDMTDIASSWVPNDWLDMMFATMAIAKQHTHQVLTKRPERLVEYLQDGNDECDRDQLLMRWGAAAGCLLDGEQIWIPFNKKLRPSIEKFIGNAHSFCEVTDYEDDELFDAHPEPIPFPLPNVWIGTSVEDRATLGRLHALRQIPAALRFVSFEPLLEDLGDDFEPAGIDWAIFGGESGVDKRQCDADWIRRGVDRCRSRGVAPFVKQLGGWTLDAGVPLPLLDEKGGDPAEWPADLRVRQFPTVAIGGR